MENVNTQKRATIKFDVLSQIIDKDYSYGGVTTLITGAKGAGKTTLMLRLSENLVANGEKIIWRGMSSCQWFFSTIPVHLLLPSKDVVIAVIDPDGGSTDMKPKEVAEKVSYIRTIGDIYRKLKKGYLNVLYLLDIYEWLDLFDYLLKRRSVDWVSILFDELEDLFPLNPSGEIWKLVERGAQQIKEFRKNYISLYAATQKISDIDYRILSKINYYIYLRGAKVAKNSIVSQKRVNFLEPGQGIIESSFFEQFEFENIIRPRKRAKIFFGSEAKEVEFVGSE